MLFLWLESGLPQKDSRMSRGFQSGGAGLPTLAVAEGGPGAFSEDNPSELPEAKESLQGSAQHLPQIRPFQPPWASEWPQIRRSEPPGPLASTHGVLSHHP